MWTMIWACICNNCGMIVPYITVMPRVPAGWKVNTEGEHYCPECQFRRPKLEEPE